MNQLAPQDRPREKLERAGPRALGDNELLALVLGHGTRACNALMLANALLDDVGGLQGLARASRGQLRRRKGVGAAQTGRIIAAVELGRRTMLALAPEERPQILTARDAANLLVPRFGSGEFEEFGVMLLDTRHRVTHTLILSTGSIDGTLVHPPEVFREALITRAAAVIVFHNHPSGDPTPSLADRELTQRLRAVGEFLGIEVLDHLILTNNKYYSFREAMPPPPVPPRRKRKRRT
jgi:DNA repair protein RadC